MDALLQILGKSFTYFFVLFVFPAAASKFHECHVLLHLCHLSSRMGNICMFLFFRFAYQSIMSVVHLILLVFRSAIKTLLPKHESSKANKISGDIGSGRFNMPLNLDISRG
jgi:hypothetical protein